MSVGSFFLDLFFPPKCAFCRAVLPKERVEAGVCAACRQSLPFTDDPRGKKKGEFFEFCLAPLLYRDRVRDSVLRFKFYGARSCCRAYAGLMAETVRKEPEAVFDLITWAPVSKKRLRKRGYDQARLIAEALAEKIGAPCAPLLLKTRHVPPQSHIKGDEKRRANVSGAYTLLPGAAVTGKRLLLVDDVTTSGATLTECSRVLLMGGAEQIVCAVLARAE